MLWGTEVTPACHVLAPARSSGAAAGAAATQAHIWEESTKPSGTMCTSGFREVAVPSPPGLPAALQGSQWCKAGKHCPADTLSLLLSPALPSETRATAVSQVNICNLAWISHWLHRAESFDWAQSKVPEQLEQIRSYPSSMESEGKLLLGNLLLLSYTYFSSPDIHFSPSALCVPIMNFCAGYFLYLPQPRSASCREMSDLQAEMSGQLGEVSFNKTRGALTMP